MTRKREPSLPELVRDTPVHEPSAADQWCMFLLDSMRPPPMTPARDALSMRLPSKSVHDLVEEVLDETREMMARQAADQLAKSNAATLAAQAETARLRKRWWMGILGDVVKWLAILALTGLGSVVWSIIKHAP